MVETEAKTLEGQARSHNIQTGLVTQLRPAVLNTAQVSRLETKRILSQLTTQSI